MFGLCKYTNHPSKNIDPSYRMIYGRNITEQKKQNMVTVINHLVVCLFAVHPKCKHFRNNNKKKRINHRNQVEKHTSHAIIRYDAIFICASTGHLPHRFCHCHFFLRRVIFFLFVACVQLLAYKEVSKLYFSRLIKM